MGYDIYITRKENWFDEEPQISLDEWRSLVASDSEMCLDGHAEAKLSGGAVLGMESDGLAVWTVYPRNVVDGNMAWFDYRAGNVVVKNPDAAILGKMWRIAQRLHARVQGDDCEFYGADGNVGP